MVDTLLAIPTIHNTEAIDIWEEVLKGGIIYNTKDSLHFV